ncbi:retrovirus-related pol polyprotein from transposon TNT 1-94 [Tanacetum coccineum]
MTTLAEFMIIAGADNRPPMLEKSLYDSWKSRMEHYMENRENGRMILNSVQNGPLIWPTVTEADGTTRTKKYEELSATEKIQADCDCKATNIVLQGLPPDVYAIVNHHKVAKEIWDRVKLLMQGTKLSLQEKECKLYDEFDKFTFVKGETLYHLPPEWSKFVMDVKLARDLHTTNYDQLYSYLEQHEVHANETRLMRERYQDPLAFIAYHSPQASTQPMTEFPQMNSSLVVPVFNLGDDPIACLNKAMAFFDWGNNAGGQARVVKCYNCQGEGHMARQCTQPKRPRNAAWFKEKAMLAEAQEAGQILDEEQLAFLADPGIPDGQAIQTTIPNTAAFQTEDLDAYDSDCDDVSNAKAVLMANLSSYGSDVLSEVPHSDSYHIDMDNQSVHGMQDFEQTPIIDFSDNETTNFSKCLVLQQELSDEQGFWLQTSHPNTDQSDSSPVKIEAPRKLPSSKSCVKCLNLDAELLNKQSAYNDISKSYSQLEKHFISLELTMQLNQEIFQKDSLSNNQNALEIPEYFENNDLKAHLQAKDTTICKLNEHIKTMKENDKEEKVKHEMDEIETINIELEHSVGKLLSKNERLHKELEHLKKIYKDQFDSIKKTRSLSKEHDDSLIAQLNSKSIENADLKHQLQRKLLVNVRDPCPLMPLNIVRVLKNTDSNIPVLSSYWIENVMLNANHDVCFFDFVNDVNMHAKSKSKSKISQVHNIWKPTGKVFIDVGLKWKPTGRLFTIVGNSFPLTRITPKKIAHLKETTSNSIETPKPEIKVYSRRPKQIKSVGSSKKAKIVESKNANNSKPNHTWGSNGYSFSSYFCTSLCSSMTGSMSKIVLWCMGDALKGVSKLQSQNICFSGPMKSRRGTLTQSTVEPAHIPKGYTQAPTSKSMCHCGTRMGLGDFDWCKSKDNDTPVSTSFVWTTNSEVTLMIPNDINELRVLEVILNKHMEKNGIAWGDKYEQMEYDLKIREKLEKWSNAAVLQNEVLNKQRYVSDKSCIGFGVESSSRGLLSHPSVLTWDRVEEKYRSGPKLTRTVPSKSTANVFYQVMHWEVRQVDKGKVLILKSSRVVMWHLEMTLKEEESQEKEPSRHLA